MLDPHTHSGLGAVPALLHLGEPMPSTGAFMNATTETSALQPTFVLTGPVNIIGPDITSASPGIAQKTVEHSTVMHVRWRRLLTDHQLRLRVIAAKLILEQFLGAGYQVV